VPDDQAATAAARKAQQDLLGMRGRQSTDLTGGGNTGGGQSSYSGTVLWA